MRRLFVCAVGVWAVGSTGCAVIGPGERGLRMTLGKLEREAHAPGPVLFNPLVSTVAVVPVRTVNRELALALPSREGLTIQAEISLLYRIRPEAVTEIFESIGTDYERAVVLTAFRSAASEVSSRHNAKDMHSSERSNIETEVRDRMNAAIGARGFEVERVLLKSIVLPAGLARAIEEKLAAEQDAQRMQFVLEREQREAERRKVEAVGLRDSQRIIDEGLTPMLIQWRSVEAFRELANSRNAKVIFTVGRTPLLLTPDQAPPDVGATPVTPPPPGARARERR
jgi:prohibitin 1